ncbi:DUF4157 domain-containing protein [Deinococcus sp. HMF7604]|uniref:eCIS core domain-containing protein n=1 Tax=Deinococcus betulae TaxID=2873312 RepID=UPI001CCBC267|nr:DUF4157 domain-containing protein [Deinococcus betulae]MBZ9753037.1 DUF4157 domain-containing protein [Deinococcus betulae]
MFEQQGASRRARTTPRQEAQPTSPSVAPTVERAVRVAQAHLHRPVRVQRQVAGPVLRAASLQQAEVARVGVQRAAVAGQLAALPAGLAPTPRVPEPVPTQPVTPGQWVTVMRHRAEQVEGVPLDTRAAAQFSALQRQVAQTLAQGFRTDRGPAAERHATYGDHLASLQRHPASAQVARAVLGLVPGGERLALQRAADHAAQRFAAQEAQAAQALHAQALQRQLAELDAEATQPVLQRIQARRGSGNPLPEAVQRHLEQGLNHDLSGVRIHDDAEAHTLATGVKALAFTTGSDIFFQSGQFNPNTQSGLELLAHEVTHTVQQRQGRVGPGIDPDAGLETEARTMGARLAAAPLPRKARAVKRPAPSLTTAPQTTAVQRWGLSDLKKLAGSAKTKLAGAVKTVQNAAQQRIQKTVKSVQKAAAPAIKAARQAVHKAQQQATRLTNTVSQKLQKAGKTVREHAGGALRAAQQRARQAVAHTRAKAQQLAHGARQFAQRAGQTARKVQAQVSQATRSAVTTLGRAAQNAVTTLSQKAQQAKRALKTATTSLVNTAKAKATQLYERARATGTQLLKATAKAKQKAKGTLKQAWSTAKTKAAEGWNASVDGAKALQQNVAGKINTIKNSPRFKATVSFLKSAGIQVLKVGTAIVVGGAVIAGAAALTAATGGLAGPALVAALFASGALGGAASTVVGNLLEGRKDKNGNPVAWDDGISAKSIITDGALGVVLGPAAKLVGGVVRGAARPVLTGLGRAATRYTPTFASGARALAGYARTGAGHVGRAAQNAATGVAGRWTTLKGAVSPALTAVGSSLPGRMVGGAFRGLDTVFSAGVRGLAKAGRGATALGGRGVKRASDWAKSQLAGRPGLANALRAPGRGLGQVGDKVKLAGYKVRDTATRGWRQGTTSIRGVETQMRANLSSLGLPVNPTRSFSGQVFAAAERNLAAMRNYASAEAKVIGAEVRNQWYGSAGSGGVLRTGREMDNLVASHPALAAGWKTELGRARGILIGARAQALRLEAQAAGRTLSNNAAKRQARALITPDDVYRQATQSVRGPFLAQATQAYRAQSRMAVTGIDPTKGLLGQLPQMYRTGARQMWEQARGKSNELRLAGSSAGAGALAGGWLSEEVFKTFTAGTTDSYKKDEQSLFPGRQHLNAGSEKVQQDFLKNVVTGMTGLTPEAQGGRLMVGTPFDRLVKTNATYTGTTSITETKELSYETPEAEQPAQVQAP